MMKKLIISLIIFSGMMAMAQDNGNGAFNMGICNRLVAETDGIIINNEDKTNGFKLVKVKIPDSYNIENITIGLRKVINDNPGLLIIEPWSKDEYGFYNCSISFGLNIDYLIFIYFDPSKNHLIISYKIDLDVNTYEKTSDLDGNIYKTVKIGNQVWMAVNLKTTKYNDGEIIPNVTDVTEWRTITTPAYCWYDNNSAHKSDYGAIYNWFTVNTSKLCPSGWHVPSDADWKVLINYLGGMAVAGEKLKSTSGWLNNGNGSNETGFTALPGGISNGTFQLIGYTSFWWSATEINENKAYCYGMYNLSNFVNREEIYAKQFGFYVRCLKD